MRDFGNREPVLVSDDCKNWTPALLVSYKHDRFYKYGVALPKEKQPVYFSNCVSVKEIEKWNQ